MDPLSLVKAVRPDASASMLSANPLRAPKAISPEDLASLKPLGLQTPAEIERANSRPALSMLAPGEAGGSTFADTLGQLVGEVNQKQGAAKDMVNGLLSGQPVPLHQAMIAMEEASVSFQLMVEVRNRLLESYQELMRMQV